jgi:hypothetical protein
MKNPPFHYQPHCSYPGCDHPAIFKIAAPWSNGTSNELKNYGLACDEHRVTQLAVARSKREGLVLADGESVGRVSLYQLMPGLRDAELTKVPDDGI